MLEFEGKVALITGAGGYIGGETAIMLAKQGAKIAVCDINEATIEKTLNRIAEIGGVAKGYVMDVTESKSVDETVEKIVKDFGRLDISIHIVLHNLSLKIWDWICMEYLICIKRSMQH